MKLSSALQVVALNKIIEFDFIIYLAIIQEAFSFTIGKKKKKKKKSLEHKKFILIWEMWIIGFSKL